MLSEAAKKQGELWGADVPTWVQSVERTAGPLWDTALNLARVADGVELLDAGCGSGGCAARALRRGARVSGFDPSEGMLAHARRALPGVDLRLAEVAEIPFESDRFDASIAVNSLQFAPDPAAGLRELLRVTKPGGRVVVVVWNSESDHRHLFAATRALFDKPPSGKGAFELAGPGELESFVAGHPASIVEIECPFEFPSLENALQGQLAVGPSVRSIEIFGRPRVEAALRAALEPFVQPDGRVLLRNHFRAACLLKKGSPDSI
jgi:SAM-dependent methyltransferase